MAIEQRSYPVFPGFPVTGPQTSPPRFIDTTTGGVRVTLTGNTFTARIQISNAQPGPNQQPHLFTPPESAWETYSTVTAANPPASVSPPVRWVRVVLDSGTLTGGEVAESTRVTPAVNDEAVQAFVRDRVDQTVPGMVNSSVSGQLTQKVSTEVSNQVPAAVNTALQPVNAKLGTPELSTMRTRGADPTGATDAAATIAAGLTAGVGRLGSGTFKVTVGLTVPDGVTLRGENARGSTIKPALTATAYVLQTAGTPQANEYDAWGEVLSNVRIDGSGVTDTAVRSGSVGLRVNGAYRHVSHVGVSGFGVGIKHDASNTYLNTLTNVASWANFYGIVFDPGVTNSGENIRYVGGASFNNQSNVYFRDRLWFITFDGMSFDYPGGAQFQTDGEVTATFVNCHIENAPGIPLFDATTTGTDIGVVLFDKTRFVNSATFTSAAADLMTAKVTTGTLIFRDCLDLVTRQRFSRVVWKRPNLPTTPPVTATPWTNNTGATARFYTRWILSPTASADSIVEAFVGVGTTSLPLRGRLFASRGGQAHDELLTIDVPPGQSIAFGWLGAAPGTVEVEGRV